MHTGRATTWKSPYVLVCLAFLVSVCCKVALLNSRDLWLDETYSAYVANLHFVDMLRFTAGDVHPRLFSMLLWAWVRVVGEAPAHLRLFSVILNSSSIVALFVVAKRILGAVFGSFATTLYAFSPVLVVYSLEVRSYMLLVLFFICLLGVHWMVAVEQIESNYLIVAYGVLSAILFYTHYLNIFTVTGLFIHWMVVAGFDRRRLLRAASTAALTLLLVLPGVPMMLTQHAAAARIGIEQNASHRNPEALSYGMPDASQFTMRLANHQLQSGAVDAGFYPAESHIVLAICALPLAAALGGILYLWLVKKDEVCRLAGIVSIILVVGLFGLSLGNHRYMLPIVPLVSLAIARTVQVAAQTVRWRTIGRVTGGLVFAIYIAGFYRHATMPHGHPWRNVVNAVQQQYRPGDQVIFSTLYSQVPFDYFANAEGFHPQNTGFPVTVYEWWNQQPFKAWGGPVLMQSDLDQLISQLQASNTKTIWLVLYETFYYDPHAALVSRLKQSGEATEILLPPDPDARASQGSPVRLFRISLK